MNRTLSSPNRMIWEYFQCLRRVAKRVHDSKEEAEIRQDTAICVFLSVTIIEAFVNTFFRVLVENPSREAAKKAVLRDIAERISLDKKTRRWPLLVFGRSLDFEKPIWQQFKGLKDRRNALMHFVSKHESASFGNLTVEGLADTTAYDTLCPGDAYEAIEVAEGVVQELLKEWGVGEKQLPHQLQSWTGKVPPELLQ